ncbi:hypothetical protein FIBSPDRAFT_126375 [Athelia psychrophila]|uniref:MYND-type domain-containing protein n=1 Tax=Athelia psychrophila TaxID=1759441 RepID=A0A166T7M5_9AGAM|nr:hypothetical protein FIBSPDRAFT_126375 [Fibularhizoctonia sp. CBS 109695]
MSNADVYARVYHGKEMCSACGLVAGRENLKTCAKCRVVRYCSRECQRVAWPQHKTRCNAVVIETPEDNKLYTEFSHWKNAWNGALRYIAIWSMDLANTPPDRLATHCVMIEIESRPNPPSRAKSFVMTSGRVLTRDAFFALCKENKGPEKLIETFETDQTSNNNTVAVILKCETFFRQIWFGYTDAEIASARARNLDVSELSADYWDDGLKDAIDAGDPSGIQRYLIQAVGRENTVVHNVPLPPFHPPALIYAEANQSSKNCPMSYPDGPVLASRPAEGTDT